MSVVRAVLAVPGDLATQSGGYGYDRRLLQMLRALGHDVAHLELGASFPDPTAEDNAAAADRLSVIPADRPVLIDGLAFGAMDHNALTGMRAPIVALIHHPLAEETGLSSQRRGHLARNETQNLALAAHVVVTSPHTGALLAAEYGVAPERITVARPGTERQPARGEPADPPLILTVGAQVRRKGHDVLVEALARIADRRWQAVIAGAALDEAYARSLADLVDRLGLGDRVRLAGNVPSGEMERLFGEAQVFALATRYEGYGMVLDEAMSYGLPIVSCDTGAVPDTVAPGAGVLVPPDDQTAFGEALARVLDDSSLRATLAAASAAAGRELPSWMDTARVVADVVERVVTKHRHADD